MSSDSGPNNSAHQEPPVNTAPKPAAKYVPMTAEDFEKKRRKKTVLWSSGIGVAVIAIMIAVWKSSDPVSAGNSFEEATRLYGAAKYTEAIASLDRAVDANINPIESRKLRGNIHRLVNDPEKAIADFTAVLAVQNNDPDLLLLRAQCYRDVGMTQRAIDDYDRLIKVKPTAASYNGRGICYRDISKIPQAIEDFSKAIELEPTVDSFLQRGMAFDSIGNHAKAIEDYNRVIELRPEMPYTYRARAYARERTGDKAGALADRTKARDIEFPPYVVAAAKAKAKEAEKAEPAKGK